jgi:hypothetical protein
MPHIPLRSDSKLSTSPSFDGTEIDLAQKRQRRPVVVLARKLVRKSVKIIGNARVDLDRNTLQGRIASNMLVMGVAGAAITSLAVLGVARNNDTGDQGNKISQQLNNLGRQAESADKSTGAGSENVQSDQELEVAILGGGVTASFVIIDGLIIYIGRKRRHKKLETADIDPTFDITDRGYKSVSKIADFTYTPKFLDRSPAVQINPQDVSENFRAVPITISSDGYIEFSRENQAMLRAVYPADSYLSDPRQ